jgi:hypothetical protein
VVKCSLENTKYQDILMAKYEIPKIVRNNILKLLARVDIKGAEAPTLVEILQILDNPIKEQKKK